MGELAIEQEAEPVGMSERGGFVGGPRKVSRRARRGKRESLRQPESSETAKSTLRVSTCRELNRAIREVSAVIRVSAFARYLAFAPGDKSDRPDQISNVAEKANRDAARCSKSPKPISSSALSM